MTQLSLTSEQQRILRSTGDIKINAVAGSGKTTTMIEYAKSRPAGSRILYLAFNKTVKLEALRKFEAAGLSHIDVETAHSLAYRWIVRNSAYQVRKTAYKTQELAELLGLSVSGEKHGEYILANHVNRLVSYFCNSDAAKVQDLNYLDIVTGDASVKFARFYHASIVQFARLFLQKMNDASVEITHDFYLKKFQLSRPQLPYDYILFDEGQDASAAMLRVFLDQPAVKVIVGDRHQQIYSWRFAVNSLEKVPFPSFDLSGSFRFRPDIAGLAAQVLDLKNLLKTQPPVTLSGLGSSDATATKAVLARTNLGLLLRAIELVTEKRQVKKVYFEGNLSSYTYAEDGASLYDVLHLSTGYRTGIKDSLISRMNSMEELEEYIEKTEDRELGMMVEIVREYGSRIPAILQNIREKHVPNDERHTADLIFSTVHRCKGMEYDIVHLAGDFITQSMLNKLKPQAETDPLVMQRLMEEINLLYVAVTRTRNQLFIPEEILPEGVAESPRIHPMKKEEPEAVPQPPKSLAGKFQKKDTRKSAATVNPDRKPWSLAVAREKNQTAYKPWTEIQDKELVSKYQLGFSGRELAALTGRSRGAIKARLLKLGLEEDIQE